MNGLGSYNCELLGAFIRHSSGKLRLICNAGHAAEPCTTPMKPLQITRKV
jgi:hypothetical protein